MTGRYPIRFGMQRAVNRPFSEIGLPDKEDTLPELLAKAGYKHRHMVGKWHLGNMLRKHLPLAQGFSSYYGPYTSGIDYFKHTRRGQHDFHRDGKTVFEEGYATHLLSAEAVIEGQWKLIRQGKPVLDQDDPTQNAKISLYNLADDVSENSDLAAMHPDRVTRMLEELVAFRKLRSKTGVPPMVEPEPKGWNPPKNWEPRR